MNPGKSLQFMASTMKFQGNMAMLIPGDISAICLITCHWLLSLRAESFVFMEDCPLIFARSIKLEYIDPIMKAGNKNYQSVISITPNP